MAKEGWPREPARHGLAARGIKTTRRDSGKMPSADSGPFETRHLRDQLRRLRRAEEILKKDVTRARQERAFDELKIFKKDLKSVMEAAESIERAIAKFNSRKRI